MGTELRKPGLAWGWGESLLEQRRLRGPLRWAASECLGSDDRWGGAWPGGEFPDFSSATCPHPGRGFPEGGDSFGAHLGQRGLQAPLGISVCKGTCLPRDGLAASGSSTDGSPCRHGDRSSSRAGPCCVWQGAEQCPFTHKMLAALPPALWPLKMSADLFQYALTREGAGQNQPPNPGPRHTKKLVSWNHSSLPMTATTYTVGMS